MQFMPSTWETYGVDANGDGVARPLQPRRRDLRRRQLPERGGDAGRHLRRDLRLQPRRLVRRRGARQRQLLRAARSAGRRRRSPLTAAAAGAELPAGPAWRDEVPAEYLAAFESAAGRYDLGQRGVWALAAVARLESNFGRGMGKRAAATRRGPLGLEPSEWQPLRGRRRRRRPHPPRRPGRLGRHPGAADLVAGQPPRRHLRPQPGRLVRAGGARRSRTDRRRLPGPLRRLAARAAARPRPATSTRSRSAPSLVTGRSTRASTSPAIAARSSRSATPRSCSVGAPGWPGRRRRALPALDGPLQGETIFVYEGVDATVQAGADGQSWASRSRPSGPAARSRSASPTPPARRSATANTSRARSRRAGSR